MTDKLTLKIITPDSVVLEAQVDSVTATAIDGQLQILRHHIPLITALAIDVLHYRTDKTEETVAVLGGLLEVGENVVTVLSDTAELGHEIDEAQAHERLAKAAAEKTTKLDKMETYETEMAISKAMARVRAVEHVKRRRGMHASHSLHSN